MIQKSTNYIEKSEFQEIFTLIKKRFKDFEHGDKPVSPIVEIYIDNNIVLQKKEKVNKDIENLLKKTDKKDKELVEIYKAAMPSPTPPELIPEYPICFVFNYNKNRLSFLLDNKPLFQLCLQENEDAEFKDWVIVRWTKTVLEYYRGKTAKKYRDDEGLLIELLEDRNIKIDSEQYKAIQLLYAGKKSKKTVKNPRTLKQYKAVEKKFYKLKKQDRHEGYNNTDIANVLFKDEYNDFYGKKYRLGTINTIIKHKKWNYTLNQN